MTHAFNAFTGWFISWGMYVYKELALCNLHFIVFEIISFRIVVTEEHPCLRGRDEPQNCIESGELQWVVLLPQDLGGKEVPGQQQGQDCSLSAWLKGLGCTCFCTIVSNFRCGVRKYMGWISSVSLCSLWPCLWTEWPPVLVRSQQEGSSHCLQGHAGDSETAERPQEMHFSKHWMWLNFLLSPFLWRVITKLCFRNQGLIAYPHQ